MKSDPSAAARLRYDSSAEAVPMEGGVGCQLGLYLLYRCMFELIACARLLRLPSLVMYAVVHPD